MKKAFEIVFERINKLRLESDICADFWGKLLRLKDDFNEDDCWFLLFDNIQWLINKNIIKSSDLLQWFSEKDLSDKNIFFKGTHEVKNNQVIGFGNAHIEASGHSKVTLFDSSHCLAFDTSFVTCFDSSTAVVSDCIVNGFHNSKITVKGFGLCESFDDCKVIAENRSVVFKHDNSTVASTIGVTIL